MPVTANAQQLARAADWIRRNEGRVTYRAEEQHGDGATWWRASALAQLDVAGVGRVPLERHGTSRSRDGALELARIELTGAIARLHVEGGITEYAIGYLEGHVYRAGDDVDQVADVVRLRGGRRPTVFEVNAARIRLKAGELTVGDVAHEILLRQEKADPDARVGQGSLL